MTNQQRIFSVHPLLGAVDDEAAAVAARKISEAVAHVLEDSKTGNTDGYGPPDNYLLSLGFPRGALKPQVIKELAVVAAEEAAKLKKGH